MKSAVSLIGVTLALAMLPVAARDCPADGLSDAHRHRSSRRPRPGGLFSLFARLIATRLEQRLGRTFVVENKPGAGTVRRARSRPSARRMTATR